MALKSSRLAPRLASEAAWLPPAAARAGGNEHGCPRQGGCGNPVAEEEPRARLRMSPELGEGLRGDKPLPVVYLVVVHHAEGVLVACNQMVAVLAQVCGGERTVVKGLGGPGCSQGVSPPSPIPSVPWGQAPTLRPCPHPLEH